MPSAQAGSVLFGLFPGYSGARTVSRNALTLVGAWGLSVLVRPMLLLTETIVAFGRLGPAVESQESLKVARRNGDMMDGLNLHPLRLLGKGLASRA